MLQIGDIPGCGMVCNLLAPESEKTPRLVTRDAMLKPPAILKVPRQVADACGRDVCAKSSGASIGSAAIRGRRKRAKNELFKCAGTAFCFNFYLYM